MEQIKSEFVVIKVGMILLRTKKEKEEIWIPTQVRRTTFPLWNIGGLLQAEDTEGEMWAKWEMKLRDMIIYDFLEMTRMTAELMESIMAKVAILHKVQQDTTFAYFIGYIRVKEEFDEQPQRRINWFPKSELMEMVRDGKAKQGSVPLSMRVIVAALRITVTGSMTVYQKQAV